jgi:hypothetical protein
MEHVSILYVHLEYFTVIWYNLRPFGIVCGYLVYFFLFWYVWTKKNLANLRLGDCFLCQFNFFKYGCI